MIRLNEGKIYLVALATFATATALLIALLSMMTMRLALQPNEDLLSECVAYGLRASECIDYNSVGIVDLTDSDDGL